VIIAVFIILGLVLYKYTQACKNHSNDIANVVIQTYTTPLNAFQSPQDRRLAGNDNNEYQNSGIFVVNDLHQNSKMND